MDEFETLMVKVTTLNEAVKNLEDSETFPGEHAAARILLSRQAGELSQQARGILAVRTREVLEATRH